MGSANSVALLSHFFCMHSAHIPEEALLLPLERQRPLPCKKTQTLTQPLLLLFPSSDEPRQLLPIKVSRSLEQALEKLNLSSKDKAPEGSCASSGELMDGGGIAYGKFGMGFCMAGSAQAGRCCMLGTSKPTELYLEAHCNGLRSGAIREKLRAGGGAVGRVWGCVPQGEAVLLSQGRRLLR